MNHQTTDDPKPDEPANHSVDDDVCIYFPCEGGKEYSWNQQLRGASFSDFRTDLLKRQYEWEDDIANGPARYSTCGCFEEPTKRAKFAIRKRTIKVSNVDVYSFARFPKRGTDHAEGCLCRSVRFDFSGLLGGYGGADEKLGKPLGADFDGLSPESEDPEFLPVRTETSRNQYAQKRSDKVGHRKSSSAPSLRRLGEFLLQESGICDWKPAFRQRRDERAFNGLIAATIGRLKDGEATNRYARAVAALSPVKFVPWSYYRPSTDTTRSLATSKCMVGFGFISHLERPSETGARMMTIRSNPEHQLLVPAAVLAKASRNVQTPLNRDSLPFPIWAIFVVREFSGVLKVCAMEGYRVTRVGAIPVCSHDEEQMLDFLMRRSRRFRRLLLPPSGTNYVPDFRLLDTAVQEYIEVAGLMDDPTYAEGIEDKQVFFGSDKVLVWDTRRSIATFVKKYERIFGYISDL